MTIEKSSLIPYSVQIADSIKKMIIRERLPVYYQLSSVKEFSEEFSVSIETVRAALRELSNQGVVSVERGKGTFVAKDYLSLMKEEEVPELVKRNIGVLMHPFPKEEERLGPNGRGEHIKSWWGERIFSGVHSQAGTIGRFLTVIPRVTSEVKEIARLIEDSTTQVSGYIIFPFNVPEEKRQLALGFLSKLKLPWVTINKLTSEQMYNFVTVDYYLSGRLAAKHLLERGHDSFLLLGDYKDTSVSRIDRLNGFISVLKEQGLSNDNFHIFYAEAQNEWYDFNTIQCGCNATYRFLEEHGKPDAIFAVADHLALGAIQGATKAGFKVPEDISIMGATGLEIGEHSNPKLTTVASPMYTLGLTCVNFLVGSIEAEIIKRRGATLEPKLLIRESTRQ